jgi:azurin
MRSDLLSRRRCALLSLAALGALAACDRKPREVELYVESDGDFPIFKPKELSCPTGAHVRLTFHHSGTILTQSHNWVLVRPGTVEGVLTDGEEAGEDSNWLKKGDPRVIAATPLIGKGASVTIEFTAPVPGDYPYICTTPGHADDMNGILHVTRN